MTAYKKDLDQIRGLKKVLSRKKGVLRALETDAADPRHLKDEVARIDDAIDALYAKRTALIKRIANAPALLRKARRDYKKYAKQLKALELAHEIKQYKELKRKIDDES